ncbi:MAG TPA: SDR family NAD(P)-dependent oxidoreductase [Candidatus Nanopelagicales bacterium]|nr:SDR family NAD(P)-dependent oxidoreductase [Candidatus Nanopelagicales bacterium]
MLTVVIGVGPGLGMSLARRFGRAGDVALLVLDDESGSRFVGELAEQGTAATAYVADLADEQSLRGALRDLRDAVGVPDVVVYNASIGVDVGPGEVSSEQVLEAMSVGTLGAVAAYQELVPGMRERGSGTFVVTGSGVSLNPWPGTIALTLDKAALRAFALAVFRENKTTGVHCGTVTIDGLLRKPGFEPDTVAETFWAFYVQGEPTAELVHRP